MWKIISLLVLMLVSASNAASTPRERYRLMNTACPEECVNASLEISFVVDGSSSIGPLNFTMGLQFIEDFVRMFHIGPRAVRVSMVTFGFTEHHEFDFDTYDNNHDLQKAIAQIHYPFERYTNTSAGIRHMLTQQKPKARPGVRHVAIVLTDGNSQEWQETKNAAAEAKMANLEVFAVGIGINVSDEELHNIASDKRHVFKVSTYAALEEITDRLTHQTCNIPTYPECEMDPVDLSFVIDSSRSIERDNFTLGMKFVTDFVDSFLINRASVRVSAVTFDVDVNTGDAFGFTAYPYKKDLLDALNRIPYRDGPETNTGAGIRFMREEQMSHGRRDSAHVCVVITDGNSQNWTSTEHQAKLARDAGIVMYGVGVGKTVSFKELLRIAGDESRVLTSDNYAELNLIKRNLTQVTCTGVLSALEHKSEHFKSQPVPHSSF